MIFCGINPASSAALAGHNFSHPSNRFWAVLHGAGFTNVQLEPRNEDRLLEFRCGITAVVERPTKKASEVRFSEFVAARPRFEAKIRRFAPRVIAFLGKRAFSSMTGEVKIVWGEQSVRFGGALTWVLPNPSGLNRSFTKDTLVEAYVELRQAFSRR